MSAGGSADGAAAGAVDSMHLLILGVVGGLLCIYLSGFFAALFFLFAFFSSFRYSRFSL